MQADHQQDQRYAERSKTSVLVVENDPAIRGMLHMMLDLEGYPVQTVSHAAEALRELDTIREPRVVLVNQLLPDADGAQVLAAASSHPALRRHRYVLMSTCPSCTSRSHASPRAGLLPKPFSVEQLLDAVEGAASDLLAAISPTGPLAPLTPANSSHVPAIHAERHETRAETPSQARPGISPRLISTFVALTVAVYATAAVSIAVARHRSRKR